MKRLLIFIVAAMALLSSCGTQIRTTQVFFADFTKHPDMWISPNACPFDHQPLGMLNISITPGMVSAESTLGRGDSIYAAGRSVELETLQYDELLDITVSAAKARGANGLSNLSITWNKTDGVYEISALCVLIQ